MRRNLNFIRSRPITRQDKQALFGKNTFSCESVHGYVCTAVCCGRRRRERWFENWVCCRVIEGGTAFVVFNSSAGYVVYKKRQRGSGEPLGSSKDSYFDGSWGKR